MPPSNIVTTEEAAALMIGLDFIPPGISFLGMVAAFLEEAEVELHNAKIDQVDWRQESLLKQRMEACKHRLELAKIYLEALELELGKGDASLLAPRTDGSVSSRIDLDKLSTWAANLFGISISSPWASSNNSIIKAPTNGETTVFASELDLENEGPPKSIASTYTTFSLLLEAFVKFAPKKYTKNDEPNISAIAQRLEELGKNYNVGMVWGGQGVDAIRNRISMLKRYHPTALLKK